MPAKALIAVISMAAAVGALPPQTVAAPQKPVIASVAIDADTGTIFLRGFNFPKNPKVYMGKDGEGMDLLQIRNSSHNMIEATLKATSPGKHLVAVLDQGVEQTEATPFVPQSLPASSPVFADALIYVVILK